MITITEKAKDYLKTNLKEVGKQGLFVSVTKGGCSGMQYKFAYQNEAENAEIIDYNEFKIFIDKNALLFIIGTQMDYVETNTSAKLLFINPNAKHNCGCGKSFGL